MHLLTHSIITFRKCSILSNSPHCKVREEPFQATNRQRERSRTYSVGNEISVGTKTHSLGDKCLAWRGGWRWRGAVKGGREGEADAKPPPQREAMSDWGWGLKSNQRREADVGVWNQKRREKAWGRGWGSPSSLLFYFPLCILISAFTFG